MRSNTADMSPTPESAAPFKVLRFSTEDFRSTNASKLIVRLPRVKLSMPRVNCSSVPSCYFFIANAGPRIGRLTPLDAIGDAPDAEASREHE
jgi:hypothetical protein